MRGWFQLFNLFLIPWFSRYIISLLKVPSFTLFQITDGMLPLSSLIVVKSFFKPKLLLCLIKKKRKISWLEKIHLKNFCSDHFLCIKSSSIGKFIISRRVEQRKMSSRIVPGSYHFIQTETRLQRVWLQGTRLSRTEFLASEPLTSTSKKSG